MPKILFTRILKKFVLNRIVTISKPSKVFLIKKTFVGDYINNKQLMLIINNNNNKYINFKLLKNLIKIRKIIY